mgnify:CR=1 FL=1
MNLLSSNFYNKKIFIYGLARTGTSTLNFLKNKGNKLICWDDKPEVRKKINKNFLLKSTKQLNNNSFDFIVISPGINKNHCSIKNFLNKNTSKIITDLDIFYSFNYFNKIISITGTNGKSTTCKLLYEIFKASGYEVQLGGNIGRPLLDLNRLKKNGLFILELSSYQLDYTKYFRSNHAAILNISSDHLERHKNVKNYINSKVKIFKFQRKTDTAYLNGTNKYFSKIKKDFKSKIKIIKLRNIYKLKKKITNNYLLTSNNLENLAFVLNITKEFKLNKKIFFKVINKFRGLPHRQEKIYKGKKIICINDSKATSFDASKQALNSYKNIFWILGGINKKNDKIYFKKLKKNIVQAYIFGKNKNFFIKKLKNKIVYKNSTNLSQVFPKVIKDIKIFKKKYSNYKILTLLFSPAAASFDSYKDFEERGNHFKKLFRKNKNKLIHV